MTTDNKRIRRNHSAALKAQVLAECEVPGTSVAKVAMSHGINANIVHGWRKLARERVVRPGATTAFVPLAIEAASPEWLDTAGLRGYMLGHPAQDAADRRSACPTSLCVNGWPARLRAKRACAVRTRWAACR